MSNDFYITSILPHAGIIIKICRAYTDSEEDFEDFYQEACLQIWKSRDAFQNKSKWSTWIYRITLNVCLTLSKKNKRRANTIEVFHEETDKNTAFEDENLNLLYDAIKKLSELDRAIILLYLEENPNKEIAAIIGTSANNIGVRINRIKKQLKILLDGKIN
ncbi:MULTISPECIES: RNA polymerase sigma factor [unclassified Tenacibaculum]|uniref:RNA polymerase sigma factor n=1 Tax=unclassified Tenacibaculum TaxID=2635139 RepID=UPI001F1AFEC0|nr:MULTISPECIES: sigma-70 family RNA polymerase sigma factor [unclassified Tenacibaculum]MCF2873447.1 sigma-70 family RNA polymerase sigma factor [Tenacibaculum sp. Cn5-1]MCF2933603.1 sigma-70 family RNA polymerase sigma factor [Tenacibaculum sp. Cn5-34]MCG7509815.1 sigma-70 family RNA polymerase sigma factor [Tenacibaculum sp. Cn5-46]